MFFFTFLRKEGVVERVVVRCRNRKRQNREGALCSLGYFKAKEVRSADMSRARIMSLSSPVVFQELNLDQEEFLNSRLETRNGQGITSQFIKELQKELAWCFPSRPVTPRAVYRHCRSYRYDD